MIEEHEAGLRHVVGVGLLGSRLGRGREVSIQDAREGFARGAAVEGLEMRAARVADMREQERDAARVLHHAGLGDVEQLPVVGRIQRGQRRDRELTRVVQARHPDALDTVRARGREVDLGRSAARTQQRGIVEAASLPGDRHVRDDVRGRAQRAQLGSVRAQLAEQDRACPREGGEGHEAVAGHGGRGQSAAQRRRGGVATFEQRQRLTRTPGGRHVAQGGVDGDVTDARATDTGGRGVAAAAVDQQARVRDGREGRLEGDEARLVVTDSDAALGIQAQRPTAAGEGGREALHHVVADDQPHLGEGRTREQGHQGVHDSTDGSVRHDAEGHALETGGAALLGVDEVRFQRHAMRPQVERVSEQEPAVAGGVSTGCQRAAIEEGTR